MPNVLLSESTLAYELPQYDQISLTDYQEAIELGLAQARAEITEIAEQSTAPTFENTIEALEKSGQLLARALGAFYPHESSDGSEQMRDYQAKLAVQLADFDTWLVQNQKLFDRIDAIHSQLADLNLTKEQTHLVNKMWQERKVQGIDLPADEKATVQQLKSELSRLEASFENYVTNDRNDSAVIFESEAELAGLSSEQLQACARKAESLGKPGKYVVELVNTTGHPYLLVLQNRNSRRRLFEAQRSVGRRGNQWDTRNLVLQIVKKRAQCAKLLGFENYVGLQTAVDSTAETADRIKEVIYPMALPVRANQEKEAVVLQQKADEWAKENGVESFELKAWDWQFFANQVKQLQSGIDEEQLREYFEYKQVLEDGVFFAANQLYGITFRPRPDLHGFHSDIYCYEVFDQDGTKLALFLHDPYARSTKQGGAWMTNLVEQSKLFNKRPVIINSLNIPKPAPGDETLLTLDEVETMFHEFGHSLHGIFSDVRYPSVSGTNVARDYVEFPSQINEMWQFEPKVLANYAKHYKTGEPIPAEIVKKLTAPTQFNAGYVTGETLAGALLDQEWHRISVEDEISSVEDFESKALTKVGLDNPLVPPRYSSTYFRHTFAGGYPGAYYSYFWADILAAETEEWLTQNGGLSRENGDKFRFGILANGAKIPEMEQFVAFLGRHPKVEPLARKRGLN